MADLKTITIGGRDLGKITAINLALMNQNDQIIFERKVKSLENAGIKNARQVLEQAMEIFSFQDLNNCIDNLKETLKNLKPKPENEPSKYFSKSKNNFKKITS